MPWRTWIAPSNSSPAMRTRSTIAIWLARPRQQCADSLHAFHQLLHDGRTGILRGQSVQLLTGLRLQPRHRAQGRGQQMRARLRRKRCLDARGSRRIEYAKFEPGTGRIQLLVFAAPDGDLPLIQRTASQGANRRPGCFAKPPAGVQLAEFRIEDRDLISIGSIRSRPAKL